MRSEAESHPSIGPEIANPGADLANFLNFFGIPCCVEVWGIWRFCCLATDWPSMFKRDLSIVLIFSLVVMKMYVQGAWHVRILVL